MDQFALLEILGRAFADGATDKLMPLLAEGCKYESQYANRKLHGAQAIIENMKRIHANLNSTCTYTYKIIDLASVSKSIIPAEEYENTECLKSCTHGLLLYQYGSKTPVAVVVCKIDSLGRLASILLSRDQSLFDLEFYGEVTGDDSPNDIPSTVSPLSRNTIQASELRKAFTGQKWETVEEKDDTIYIWRNADKFIKGWLPENGYHVLESQVFDDCIGYRCVRRNVAYTVFMYAYGQSKTTMLDGDYCSRLEKAPFAKESLILIVYLNVTRYKEGDSIEYRVQHYGKNDRGPELWQLTRAGDKPILLYFPRKEMVDQVWQIMYAFNHDATDIYDCIITDHNPSISGCTSAPGHFMNAAFYNVLKNVHDEYGDMKLGYVRYNDVVYSSVPYIDGLGFFSFRTDNHSDKILELTCHSFDESDRPIAEFIKTDTREPADLFDFIPTLLSAEPLDPTPTERFAAKLLFDNGECRKYVLAVNDEKATDEVVAFSGHVFTNGIWRTVKVLPQHESRYANYPNCGPALTFKNECTIAGTRCYIDSTPYSEPITTNELVYSDDLSQVRKLWFWKANSMYEDEETGLLKVLLSGQAFNWYGKSVFATIEGKRLTSLTFDLIDSFKEGLSRVALSGHGFGYVDRSMRFVIPMKYDEAEEFSDGRACVKYGDRHFFIGKDGKEIASTCLLENERYQEICDFSEGLCRVSTLKLRFGDLAFHSDYAEIAGVWGYINEDGEEIITPQYIYANDFEDGIAIVAKGKWTIDPKWNNKYNSGRYWTEEELWGGIDPTGAEVIPFIFDEIKYFWDCNDYYIAHFGGWENGHWGVIDRQGKWVADPVFEDIAYDFADGLFAFYESDKWDDDVLMGIYDIHERKVVFDPQFLDVNFLSNGDISVDVFDPELGRKVERIIERNGRERFKSVYTSIHTWKEPYEVIIREQDEDKHGLIDKNGNVIVPCIYAAAWNGFDYENKRFIYIKDGKQGVKDLNGNTIIPAAYYEIHGLTNPYLTVRVGEKDNYKEGLITASGQVVVPAIYNRIGWCKDQRHFFCCSDGHCEMYCIEPIKQ